MQKGTAGTKIAEQGRPEKVGHNHQGRAEKVGQITTAGQGRARAEQGRTAQKDSAGTKRARNGRA